MYRHPAQINVARSSLPSPAREEPSDSEADILAELDEKRRELDDEIASFRAQKEREFRIFERELRSKRKGPWSKPTDKPAGKGTSATAAVSTLFVGKQTRPHGLSKRPNGAADLSTSSSRLSALPSQPTVGVDRLTINGTTTPPVIGTPPLTRSVSRSPTNLSLTPPRKSASKLLTKRDSEKAELSGLFTPTYLPLLEAQRGTSLPPARVTSPQPKRALAVPTRPSTSLPSALRTASGSTIRKRKHVTFQLGGMAIVEPSSSYEEPLSPERPVAGERMDDVVNTAAIETTPAPVSPDVAAKFFVAKGGGLSVGFFELDEELDDLDDPETDYHEDPDEDPTMGHGEDEAENELKPGSFHAGSLPIDIVRPGSFRDGSAIQ